MKLSYDKRIEMATECFAIDDYINGTLSGGISTPRRVISIDAKNRPQNSIVTISYTYDDNLYYTDLRTGKTYKLIYHIDSNGIITKKGSDKLFDIDEKDSFYDLWEREITAFY